MNLSAFSGRRRGHGNFWRVNWLTGVFAMSGMLAGCQAAPPHADSFRRGERPVNVFAYPAKLSLDLRRVAVLPLAAETGGRDLPEGCAALAPVLWEQLVKARKFEVVTVEAANLRRSSGQTAWTGLEVLPPDFLASLRREYACDGVLFAELTAYRAYAPLAVGWRLKLVDVRSGQILWAADELFDAAQPAVYRAAQRYAGPRSLWPFGREENWVAANSPRQFGRYAAAAVLDTLPER